MGATPKYEMSYRRCLLSFSLYLSLTFPVSQSRFVFIIITYPPGNKRKDSASKVVASERVIKASSATREFSHTLHFPLYSALFTNFKMRKTRENLKTKTCQGERARRAQLDTRKGKQPRAQKKYATKRA